jgi:hypothetical protein
VPIVRLPTAEEEWLPLEGKPAPAEEATLPNWLVALVLFVLSAAACLALLWMWRPR